MKSENMVEIGREYLFVQCDRCIDQMELWRLKTDLEDKIETYKNNKENSDGEGRKYNRKKREYDDILNSYKSARRNLETKLDEQGGSLSNRVTEACKAAREILREKNNFTTQVEEAECRKGDARSDVVRQERELHTLETKMRQENENHRDNSLYFWKNMEGDLTTALAKWKRENDYFEQNIKLWEKMVEIERERVAALCQEYIDSVKEMVYNRTTQSQQVNAGVVFPLGGVTVGVATIISGRLLLPALTGVGLVTGGLIIKDTVFFKKAKTILTAVET